VINIYKIGRVVAFSPAELGVKFEKQCTVTVMESQDPSPENKWKRTRVAVDHPLFWYADDPDTKARLFCTYGGYFAMLHEELSKLGLEVVVTTRRSHGLPPPDISKLRGIEWRPHQKEVVAHLLSADGGVIVCPTAQGKSFIMRQVTRAYPTSKIVITVSSLDVARTLFDEMKDFVPNLGFCGTGRQNPQRVTVAVTNSLDRCDFDASLVMVDECHTALAPSVIKKLNQFRRAKLFGLTASPTGRSDGGDGFMEALFGRVLYDMTYQQGVAAGNIVQLRVKMYRSARGLDLSGIEDKTYVDRHGIILNGDRNILVVRATRELEQELGPDAQILLMVDKIEHAYILGRELPEYTVVTGVMPKERSDELIASGVIAAGTKLCSAPDRDRYRKMFEKNELKRVIATRVWEKGVDFRDLAGLVRADGLASPIAACQIPGRLSRLGKTTDKTVGVLVDFADLFSKNLKSRSRKRLASYRKCGWIIENHA
jgi:superfamily II DNA or RNA helicase